LKITPTSTNIRETRPGKKKGFIQLLKNGEEGALLTSQLLLPGAEGLRVQHRDNEGSWRGGTHVSFLDPVTGDYTFNFSHLLP
jgi:hypothetical protein